MQRLFLCLLLIVLVAYSMSGVQEGWQNYVLSPFGEVRTGNDPLYFYNYNRYRRPLNWPYRFFSSYPYPHMEPGL